jgi:Family of unknown function (DUF6364)
MAKLTLNVDRNIVVRAKRYARQQGSSVSEMVEAYLAAVTAPAFPADTQILRSIRGSLKKGSVADYRKHLAAKYR